MNIAVWVLLFSFMLIGIVLYLRYCRRQTAPPPYSETEQEVDMCITSQKSFIPTRL
jgi:cytochrome c-type biogenesis protein CcmH/NrfF